MSRTPAPIDRPSQRTDTPQRSSPLPVLPLVLLFLALLDLRTELILLLDHVTLTTLLTTITAHPLAIAVLLAQPSLWRRYRRAER